MPSVGIECFLLLECKWEPSAVEDRPGLVLSKMIKFRGEKVFRAGLKNQGTSSILYFMMIDISKVGIDEAAVLFRFHNKREMIILHSHEDGVIKRPRRLQLYTAPFRKKLSGDLSFHFEVLIRTNITPNYVIERLDGLLGQQLWSSAVNQEGTDHQFIAEGKSFFVHKFVLSARSPVFRVKFSALEIQLGEQGSSEFEDYSYVLVEQFLKFIYTGELEGAVSPQLKEVAEMYEIETLKRLCESGMPNEDEMKQDFARLSLLLKSNGESMETK